MPWLPRFFRRPKRTRSDAPSDFFDILHAPTMEALADGRGQSLGDWSASDADDSATAPRLILGIWREQNKVRRRFPRVISGDFAYRDWLLTYCAGELKLAPAAMANVAAAFVQDPAAPVREFYLHTPEVQWRYPLGLLPIGQKRFAKWLLSQSRGQHELSDEQILWFLQVTAEDLPTHIALTYLVHPGWQERFPRLSDDDGFKLIKWLRAEFPKYRPFRTIESLPPRIANHLAPPDNAAGAVAPPALAGVNILSHFCYPSGIQQAGLEARFALETAGLRTSCRDVPTGVRTDLTAREPWLGLEEFPITLTNVAPVPHFESRYRRAGLTPGNGALQVAYWAWELDTVPENWKRLAASLTEIWAPTPFVSQALRDAMPVPVVDMLPGVSVREIEAVSRELLGIADSEFVFLFMFDMQSDFQRKNPLAVVRAFQRAFGGSDKARLVIKISRGASDPANLFQLRRVIGEGKVLLMDEVVSRARVFGYIEMADCVVSLHRSEGFGLLMAEAMLLGKPVIATNYSGNTAFMNRENSLLVDYELVPVAGTGPIYEPGKHWAEPSVDHAAEYMRRVFANRAEAMALGARARGEATQQLSPDSAGARMRARLSELWERAAQ